MEAKIFAGFSPQWQEVARWGKVTQCLPFIPRWTEPEVASRERPVASVTHTALRSLLWDAGCRPTALTFTFLPLAFANQVLIMTLVQITSHISDCPASSFKGCIYLKRSCLYNSGGSRRQTKHFLSTFRSQARDISLVAMCNLTTRCRHLILHTGP